VCQHSGGGGTTTVAARQVACGGGGGGGLSGGLGQLERLEHGGGSGGGSGGWQWRVAGSAVGSGRAATGAVGGGRGSAAAAARAREVCRPSSGEERAARRWQQIRTSGTATRQRAVCAHRHREGEAARGAATR